MPPSASIFELPWDLLDRYCAGEVTSEERIRVETSLSLHGASSQILAQVAAELQGPVAASPTSKTPQIERMLATLHERMHPRMALKRFVQTYLGGSIERAVATLLDAEDTQLTAEKMTQLRQAIAKAREEGR